MTTAQPTVERYTTRLERTLPALQDRIERATSVAGRSTSSVRLVAVTKAHPLAAIDAALVAGLVDLGENRVQELSEKVMARGRGAATWHMIGHLQTNKVRQALQLFDVVETVHSARLAQRIDAVARELGRVVPVYLEVNMGSEISKTGVDPDQVMQLAEAIASLQHVKVAGLMAVPPFTPDPEGARPYYQKLRELRDELNQRHILDYQVEGLSMGMSHDFEVAIEEGATVVRLGSSIWGSRPA